MAILTVMVDDLIPAGGTDVIVQCRWFSQNNDGSESASDSMEVVVDSTIAISATLNAQVINAAVAASGVQGVTVGLLDRKMIVGGFV